MTGKQEQARLCILHRIELDTPVACEVGKEEDRRIGGGSRGERCFQGGER